MLLMLGGSLVLRFGSAVRSGLLGEVMLLLLLPLLATTVVVVTVVVTVTLSPGLTSPA